MTCLHHSDGLLAQQGSHFPFLFSNIIRKENEDFAMEQRFVIWLYPSFCNVIMLNITPLKSILISCQLRQLIYIIVIEQNIFYKERTCAHYAWTKETKNITHFLLLRRAYTMKFFFHDLEIFISKEKCRNDSGSEMCVVKCDSVCSNNQVSFNRSW